MRQLDTPEVYESGVRVIADFSPSGLVTPRSIIWEDGRSFAIDEVTRRMETILPNGGHELWLTVRIGHNLRRMRFDGSHWFVAPLR